jgi:cytochrome P450
MPQEGSPDWDPLSEATLEDQRKAFDEMREHCPVAHSAFLGWSVFRHADIAALLLDPETFINASKFPAIPNGLNPPEHSSWYRALATFFDKEPMARLEPRIRQLAGHLLEPQKASGEGDFVATFVTPFVFKSLCALLGWPEQQWETLATWVRDNQELALKADAVVGKALADSFAALVQANLDSHRARRTVGASATDELLQTTVNGQPLTDETITTILRNWVAGHGTTGDALGLVLRQVAQNAKLQEHLRRMPALVPAAIEELLRMDGPLVANRRTTTREVELQGRTIPKDASLSLMWIAANRDPLAFKNAGDFDLTRDTSTSLVWGHGIHLCMGAPLARLEIRVALEDLLARTTHIELVGAEPVRKVYPGNGYAALHLRLASADDAVRAGPSKVCNRLWLPRALPDRRSPSLDTRRRRHDPCCTPSAMMNPHRGGSAAARAAGRDALHSGLRCSHSGRRACCSGRACIRSTATTRSSLIVQ